LEGTETGAMLLIPPGPAEISAVLAEANRDLLAYLLVTEDRQTGFAVLITADGHAEVSEVPALTDLSYLIDRYNATHQAELNGQGDVPSVMGRWADALDDLCDWAWPVVAPLLERAQAQHGDGPVRVVLIPCGSLAVVPWHAARITAPDGQLRYALQEAVISYASSGRQLVETARRPRLLPGDRAVFVADPVGDDIWPTWEAQDIRSVYYPHGTVLGSDPPDLATPERVLAWLPGRDPGRPDDTGGPASLIHLCCHALAAPSPEDSHLRLAGQEPSGEQAPGERLLPVTSILTQAQGRPAATPGGLVVLAACMSDLSFSDYDEALTLATAFLAAGAVSVVGSRWQVPDIRTALLTFMFHRHLARGEPPADALRSAQLWMLDPKRVVPLAMPQRMVDEVPNHDLGGLLAWAAFAHQGQ
jgi:hypothetical protein